MVRGAVGCAWQGRAIMVPICALNCRQYGFGFGVNVLMPLLP
jgi:hypothetical protein